MIIARTDARAVKGFEAAIERAGRYIKAGADATFVEAPASVEKVRLVPRRLHAPQLISVVVGGKTPTLDQMTAIEMGFSVLLYANVALQGAILGMQKGLASLPEREASGLLAPFAERQRLADKPLFDAMERRYAVADAQP